MGRAKLKLHKLDGSNRIGVYSRRKKGLLKKANELSVLCDIDIFLAMFSPSGKPSVYKSESSSFEDMITKIVEVNPEERAKRKMESLETIKKACKKSDHDVNIGEQLCPGDLTTEDINFLSHSLRIRLSDIEGRLRLWKNLDKIDNIQQLRKLEDSISKSLNDIAKHKEDIEREFGFTFDVPQVELMDAHGNILGCSTNNGSILPHSDFVNIHDSSTSASGACDNMMLAESLNLLYGMDSLSSDAGEEFSTYSSIKHGTNSLSAQLNVGLSVHGSASENMDGYNNLNVFDASLKFDDEQEFHSSSSIQYGMNSPVSFDAGQERNRSSSVHGGDSDSINGYEDLNSFVQGFLEDPSVSLESYTDPACEHEIQNCKPGYENCSADKTFLDCQINQEDLEIAFRSTIDLPLVEKMDAQESTFDCLNKGFGIRQLTSIIV